MPVTCGHKISTECLRHLHQERLKSEIALLKHLKAALCVRELTNSGRHYVNNLISNKEHELSNIEKQAIGSSQHNGCGASGI